MIHITDNIEIYVADMCNRYIPCRYVTYLNNYVTCNYITGI